MPSLLNASEMTTLSALAGPKPWIVPNRDTRRLLDLGLIDPAVDGYAFTPAGAALLEQSRVAQENARRLERSLWMRARAVRAALARRRPA
jgi:hypothetical protein